MKKFADIALIGSVGDGMLKRNDAFIGLDLYPVAAAFKNKQVYFDRGDYFLRFREQKIPLSNFVQKYINLAGSVGLRSGGVKLAFDLLDQKVDLGDSRISKLRDLKKERYKSALNFLKEDGYFEDERLIAFNLGSLLDPMSLKEIGNFLEYLLKNHNQLPFNVPQNKYIFGAQKVPSTQNGDLLKVSMRVGEELPILINNKQMPDFFQITQCFDNQPGGIHSLSAAVIIPERDYVRVVDQVGRFIKQASSISVE